MRTTVFGGGAPVREAPARRLAILAGVAILTAGALAGCSGDGDDGAASTAPPTAPTTSDAGRAGVPNVDPEGDLENHVGRSVEVVGVVDRVLTPNVFTVTRYTEGEAASPSASTPSPEAATTSADRGSVEGSGLLLLYDGEDAEITEGLNVTARGTLQGVADVARAAEEIGVTLPGRLPPSTGIRYFLRVEELRATPVPTRTPTATATS